jgi:hypothetical protein
MHPRRRAFRLNLTPRRLFGKGVTVTIDEADERRLGRGRPACVGDDVAQESHVALLER